MRRQLKDGTVIYSSRFIGSFLILLGLWLLAFFIGCFLLDLLAVVLMGLPTMFIGVIAMMSGMGAFVTRIELSRDRLRIAAPSWRATPLLPIQRIDVLWKDVQAVQFRREFYQVPLPMGVDVFRIQTASEELIYGGKALRETAQAMAEIAERAETSIQIESDVTPGLLKTLIFGPPKWNQVSHESDQ